MPIVRPRRVGLALLKTGGPGRESPSTGQDPAGRTALAAGSAAGRSRRTGDGESDRGSGLAWATIGLLGATSAARAQQVIERDTQAHRPPGPDDRARYPGRARPGLRRPPGRDQAARRDLDPRHPDPGRRPAVAGARPRASAARPASIGGTPVDRGRLRPAPAAVLRVRRPARSSASSSGPAAAAPAAAGRDLSRAGLLPPPPPAYVYPPPQPPPVIVQAPPPSPADPLADALGRLKSLHGSSRRDGALALGRIGDDRAVGPLIERLEHDFDSDVRVACRLGPRRDRRRTGRRRPGEGRALRQEARGPRGRQHRLPEAPQAGPGPGPAAIRGRRWPARSPRPRPGRPPVPRRDPAAPAPAGPRRRPGAGAPGSASPFRSPS